MQWILAKLFPMKRYRIEDPDEMREWMRYEAGNYPSMDPFRSLTPRDSWAGHTHEDNQIAWG